MSSAFMWYSPSELTCFICKDYFTDPVTITCGHSFCAPCLCLLWEDTRTPTCCPVCRAVSLPMNFKSIILAKKQVLPAGESFPFQSPSSAMQVCKTHQIVKIFFCPFDKILLCLLCCYSPGHATHRHHPGKQAAEHYRENILKQMKSIWKNKQENQRNLNKVTDIFREWEEVGLFLCRSQLVQLYMPKPVDPQLTAWTITGMSERLNNFRVYITLEHRISKCEAPLFEELRHLQCSSHHQDLPLNPASLEYTPSWGAQTFTSGKHYWEMDMGHSCNWIIGLCKESWAHRKDMRLNSEGIFLLLCVKVDDHFNLFSTSPLIRQYIQRPQGWVGVFLDCECGIVSFVNVAKSSLICNFLSCSFSFPLRPFICYGPK
ncbi:tripartite motif-containing protein 77 isoform X2 [Pteronotus mesoamericanus]|uniref:tripartite motif-containing protein 77 isoform X2 n=1 Tax=Pteronotus mesoamericanus TaxID=1884717 RepID=UPI0023ED961A|nr:tripartite motif-containing protein 77 isoform X2 [Pteronotus parnellii mesoamericanus]